MAIMRFADQRARLNRRFLNKLVRPLSGRFGVWSLIEHQGRRSGTSYRTPVTMFRTAGDGVAILLPYGEDRDWVRNLVAADGGRAVMGGATFGVCSPRIVPTAEAAQMLRAPWRQAFGVLQTPSVLLLERM